LRQIHQDRFSWIGPFRLRYVWAVPLRLFTYAFNNTPVGSVLSTVAVGGVLIGVVKLSRGSSEGRLVAALAVLPVTFAASVWASGLQVFALRNLISVGPFVAIALATALRGLPRPAGLMAAAALCVGLAISLHISTANTFPRFDAIARTLVQDGWGPSDPIMVFGSPFTYRSPLEWYLPRQPPLDAIRASASVCDDLFVVSPTGSVRLLRLDEPVKRDRALRHGTIFVDPAHRTSCAGQVRIHPAVA
jgi:hypothetical protein